MDLSNSNDAVFLLHYIVLIKATHVQKNKYTSTGALMVKGPKAGPGT